MITILEAQAIARSYVDSKGEFFPGVYYAVKNAKEYSLCYYYDLFFVDEQRNPPNQQFAGQPGFTVAKQSGEINLITFGDLSELK